MNIRVDVWPTKRVSFRGRAEWVYKDPYYGYRSTTGTGSEVCREIRKQLPMVSIVIHWSPKKREPSVW